MQERRENIIKSAFRLFCQRGIEAVTMAEIAKVSKVGETTMYRYFDNKSTLVLEAFIKLWDEIMRDISKSVESYSRYSELNGYNQVKLWIESFKELYISDADFILFSYEAKLYLVRHNIKLQKNQQDILMQTIRIPFLAALNKGKQDGSIPIKRNSEDIFYAVWGSVRGYIVKIVIYQHLMGEESPWEKQYEEMEAGILSALSSGWKAP